MSKDLVARSSINIKAPVSEVWEALVNPAKIKQYMFGTDVVSNWKPGSRIVWRGLWQGKKYEDKGQILKFERESVLSYSHFSPLTGKPDKPENYHTVTIRLVRKGELTSVSLTQDNNSTKKAQEHSQKNWNMMLKGLKDFIEK